MATNVTMPQLGESVTEGTIGKWLKQKGDSIAKYEPLVEIITDKVNSEIPSPADGTILDIRVPEGETVKVGALLALIGAPGEQVAAVPPAAPSSHAAPHAPEASPPPLPLSLQPSPLRGERAGRLSPVVARLASEHGVDISQIQGTGEGGRVTKQDIEKYIAARSAQPPTGTGQAAPAAPPPSPLPLSLQGRGDVREPALAGMADEEVVPLTPMRKAIAEHMVRSVHTSAHVTTVFEVDMSKVAAHRAAHKDEFARQGADLTYTAYFVEVVARVLREQPVVNSSFGDKSIVLKKAINIGVAVAIEEGLIVPVLKHADELNLLGIAKAVNDLARRAREKRLMPDDVQGGTFTITNPGVGGSLFGTPIINQPQAAIMGVGAIVKRPVVVDDAIAIRPMVYLSLTFDHRILDGAGGDKFLSAVKRSLEHYA
ncbi:MAG: 2-oxo acid dehydrogenase subunit E2 [Chloroflexi bacterium]|nr:2-oxo acid dehydrogenase subunit E2 [Chloroflexota bacterium]